MPDDENPSARAKPPIFLQDQRFAVPERGHEQLIPVLSGQRPAAANALLTAEEQRREGLRWLGQLRWWALTGALAGTLIAMSFGWSFVSPPAIAAGVVLMVLVNGVLVWRVRSSGKPGNIGQDELLLHSTADLLLLTWLLAWAGGVRNPLSVSYSFHVVLGALLSGRRGALVSSGVSLACISFLWVLEDQGRLPSLALERPPALLWALSMVMLVEVSPTSPPPSSPAASPKSTSVPSTYRLDWAALLKRVFGVDVLKCSRCCGPDAAHRLHRGARCGEEDPRAPRVAGRTAPHPAGPGAACDA